MEKSADAFRTISEVAEALDTPAHVLRFWESRFPQIRPVKRAGGRRYYRPADIALLAGIKRLLHDDGMTIRGVQKILREQGVRHVAGLTAAGPRDFDMAEPLDEAEVVQTGFAFIEPEPPRRGEVVAFAPSASSPEESLPEDNEAEARPSVEAEAEDSPTAFAEPDAAEDVLTEDEPEDARALAGEEGAPPALADPVQEERSGPEAKELSLDAAISPDGEAVPTPPVVKPEPQTEPDHESTVSAEPEALPESDGIWLPAALRALPPGALAARRADLLPLHDRLVALRERLAAAHRGGRR